MVIKVGHTLSLDIKIQGEPPPVVTWVFKDKEIKTEDQYRIDNIDYNSKFCILKTKRAHSGVYKITAKNEVGEDSAELEVTVLGKRARSLDSVKPQAAPTHLQGSGDYKTS